MGSAQSSYITPETALTALVVVGAVALGYNHIPTSSKDATVGSAAPASAGTTSQKKSKKVKGKGKTSDSEPAPKAAAPAQDTATPVSVAASGSLPGQFDPDSTLASGASKKNKKKGKKSTASTATPGGDTPSIAQSVSGSIDFLNASEIQLASPKSANEDEGAGKKKKKAKGKTATPSPASPSTSQTITPAQPPQTASSKDDKTKQKQPKESKTAKAPTAPILGGPTESTTSLDTDGSWTRVGAPRRGKGAASAEVSAAEQTTPSGTGTSSPVISRSGADDASLGDEEDEDEDEEAKPEEEREFLLSAAARASGETRKTLAERLVPKPRKTHVEDMLKTPDYPTLARVVRVRPRPDEKPAHGFTWGDYEDVRTEDDADAEGDGGCRTGNSAAENEDGDDDDGWGVVTGRKSKRIPSGTSSTPAHKATKAPETLTKKQRQNQQRRDDAKASRDAGEAERLAALEKHKRQLENERIKAQLGAEGKKGKGKESGGMAASVDDKGRLVWE